MRVSLTMVALGLGLGLTAQQNIAINATGAAADNSAILDISVAGLSATEKKGFLVPRMNLVQRNALTTVDGLTIYQTDNTPGFYYYDGTGAVWVRLTNGSPGWGILGNDVVNPANDWIGTTDAAGLSFRPTIGSTSALMAPRGAWVWEISPLPSVWR
ncbi:MAG: hypothetical protein IPI07_07345 [Flavobacteriales bacterium]|nr:hypothetical protein [Flavobacteriales bacterium]